MQAAACRCSAAPLTIPGGSHQNTWVPGTACRSYRPGWQHRTSTQTRALTPGHRHGVQRRPCVDDDVFQTAFTILDKDKDGRLSENEAYRLVAFYSAVARPTPSSANAATPVSWDQHLSAVWHQSQRLDGAWNSLERFVAAKLSGGLQKAPPRLSDLVWSAACAAAAMLVLGVVAAAVKTWPVVGHWHQQGLPLLLGSFGTLTVLLFGRPEAEAVRPWPLVAGQLGSMAIALGVLGMMGTGLMARAVAMGATIAYMMWADCIHPPGGALVLLAMDSAVIQQMQWQFLLWPSMALTCGVLLPLSALCCWLKRHRPFDWKDVSTAGAVADSALLGPRSTLTHLYRSGPARSQPAMRLGWHYRWQQQMRQQRPGARWRDPPDIPPIKFKPT